MEFKSLMALPFDRKLSFLDPIFWFADCPMDHMHVGGVHVGAAAHLTPEDIEQMLQG